MADTDRIISLIRIISADPALLDRLATTPEADRGVILTELGYGDLSPADLVGSAKYFAPSPPVEEIDDEQLASVAGGGGETAWVTDTTLTGITGSACYVAAT